MARINIEDSLFTDARFCELIALCGSVDLALGSVVRSWVVAQKYWKHDRELIPHEVWKKQRLSTHLFTVGLAEKRELGIYVSGSEKQFDWLVNARESGKRGGIRSAEVRSSDFNGLQGRDPQGTLKGFQPSSSLSLGNTNNNSSLRSELSSVVEKPLPQKKAARVFSILSIPEFTEHMRAYLDDWVKLYDAEYCNRELAKAFVWLKANPRKAKKTHRGWVQFFSGWFERGWDKATTRGPSNASESKSDGWQNAAVLVAECIRQFGNWNSEEGRVRAKLGDQLFDLACSAGVYKMRQLKADDFYIRNIIGLLKEAQLKQRGSQ